MYNAAVLTKAEVLLDCFLAHCCFTEHSFHECDECEKFLREGLVDITIEV
jgi:hypothetical protein